MTGPRNWQAETARALSELIQPGRATKRDMKMAGATAVICGILAAGFWIAAARGDTIVIGEWDSRLGGGVTPILSGTDNVQSLHTFLPGGLAGANINALVIQGPSVFREFAVDDFFNDFGGDTIRLYASFIVTAPPSGQITMPSIFQVVEHQPGWTIATQIFTCAATIFCDNDIVGGGTLAGQHIFTAPGTFTPTFHANVGSPFIITEVLHFVNDLTAPAGDVSGAILTQPDMRAVPGPVVGAGLPGLIAACFALLALARRRKQS